LPGSRQLAESHETPRCLIAQSDLSEVPKRQGRSRYWNCSGEMLAT
jgi:hypothetical protein